MSTPATREEVTLSRILTYEEAAAYLKVSKRTLRRLVSSRKIPYVDVRGSRRFDAKDLRRYIEAEKRHAGRPGPR